MVRKRRGGKLVALAEVLRIGRLGGKMCGQKRRG